MPFFQEINKNIIDVIAIAIFFINWFFYSKFADCSQRQNLVKAMHSHRLKWLKKIIYRDDRLVDIRIVSTLSQSATFFASTSILIIGGLFALAGYGEKAVPIIQELSFSSDITVNKWIVKTIILAIIFIYSFFKFTWVIRQFNYCIILIASCPLISNDKDYIAKKEASKHAENIANMISNAGSHFNKAMRSYYFAFILMSWYLNPILMIALSFLVVIVLYRREFLSKTLKILD